MAEKLPRGEPLAGMTLSYIVESLQKKGWTVDEKSLGNLDLDQPMDRKGPTSVTVRHHTYAHNDTLYYSIMFLSGKAQLVRHCPTLGNYQIATNQ